MKLRLHYLVVLLLASPVLAQEAEDAHGAGTSDQRHRTETVAMSGKTPGRPPLTLATEAGFLRGDKAFPNFIGYISNPTKAVDPRSLTQILPIYDYASISAIQRTTRAIGPLAPQYYLASRWRS